MIYGKAKTSVMFSIALSAMVAVCSSAASEELMKNPDFEGAMENGKAFGWNYDGKKAQAGRGFGRNCSPGIKYIGDGGAYEWVYQRVPVESGQDYRFEAWVKTENIVGTKGVFIAAVCYSAEGKWQETSSSPNISGTSDGWQKLTVDMRPKGTTASVELSIRVSDGETGTFYADDFSFAKTVRPPIKFLVCDAYRSTSAGGKVAFKLVSNMTDDEIAAKGWKGQIRLPSHDATSHFTTAPAPAFTNGVSSFKIDVDKMPFGEFPVSFAFVDGSGRVAVSKTVFFNHVKAMPKRRVSIDFQGLAVVDGKPFFPFGMFVHSFAGPKAEKYAKGPFNCILSYGALTRAQMDFAHSKGLKVLYSVKDIFRGAAFQPFAMADEDDEVAFVAAKVASLKDHPALLGWYTQDEAGPGIVPRLTDRDRLIRMIDPDHPTYGCLCRTDATIEYMGTSDVLGTDPYPLTGKAKRIVRVAESTRNAKAAFFGMRQLWQVVQAFDWSYYNKDKSCMYHPNGDEILNMCLQSVAAGANGVLLYSYSALGGNAFGRSQEDFEKYWQEACRAGEAFSRMIPVFLSDDASHLVEGVGDELPVRAWRHDGKVWYLAVNATYKPVKAHVRIGGKVVEIDLPSLGHALRSLD